MHEDLTLDKIHDLIAEVSIERDRIQPQSQALIEPTEFPAICDAVLALNDQVGPNDSIRVPQKLANSFYSSLEKVKSRDAHFLASRIITYLRSIENDTAAENLNNTPSESKVDHSGSESPTTIKPVVWAALPKNDEIKCAIHDVSKLLESIIIVTQNSNSPEHQRALSAIERAELIAVLETVLAVLKAPMVEKGLLQRAKDRLRKAGENAANKGVDKTLERLADEGVASLGDLISDIPWGL